MTAAQIALLVDVHVGPVSADDSNGQVKEQGDASDLLALYRMQG